MKKYSLIFLFFMLSVILEGQVRVKGIIADAYTREALPFALIWFPSHNSGTYSLKDGTFSINLSQVNEKDIGIVSLNGYLESHFSVNDLLENQLDTIELKPSTFDLKEVEISSRKLTEMKFGIKTSPILHFIEDSHNPEDTFEVAQLIKLEDNPSKITSINLFTEGSISDSVTFRVNFYAFDGKRPTYSIVKQNIVKVCEMKPGWMTIDLSKYDIYLQGNVVVSVEYIPSPDKKNNPIGYPVKIGGSSRTFVRSRGWLDSMRPNSQEWEIPPAHYRIFVTALVQEKGKNSIEAEEEEKDTPPTFRMFSKFVKDSFYIFVKLPPGYRKNKSSKYPTTYILDANVYFDQVGNSIKQFIEEKQLAETILVGIGYKDFLTADSLRDRDYTSIKALPVDSFNLSGGANNFLTFIEKELIPEIDSKYATDKDNRTIMGHSLGGQFALYVLSRTMEGKSNLFRNFISASPNLDYHNQYIIHRFREISDPVKEPKRLYMTMGSLEEDETANYREISKELSAAKYETLKSKIETYQGHSHMETAIPSFEKGLQFVLPKY